MKHQTKANFPKKSKVEPKINEKDYNDNGYTINNVFLPELQRVP